MKGYEQYSLVVLFIMLKKVILTIESQLVIIQINANEQYFHVLLFEYAIKGSF